MNVLTSRFSYAALIITFSIVCILGIGFNVVWAGADESDSADDEVDLTFEWTEDVDCTLCHSKQSSTFGDPETLAGQHVVTGEDTSDEDSIVDEESEEEVTLEEDGDDEEAITEEETEFNEVKVIDGEIVVVMDDETVNDEEIESETVEVIASVTCFDCHTNDDDQLAEAHDGVEITDTKGARRLISTRVTDEECETCHDIDEVTEATADIDILVDSNGTLVKLHDLPSNDSHDAITCVTCHTVHVESEIDQAAIDTCMNCHHKGVFECGTCHD